MQSKRVQSKQAQANDDTNPFKKDEKWRLCYLLFE